MLQKELNELLTRTGSGTPGGEFMRNRNGGKVSPMAYVPSERLTAMDEDGVDYSVRARTNTVTLTARSSGGLRRGMYQPSSRHSSRSDPPTNPSG